MLSTRGSLIDVILTRGAPEAQTSWSASVSSARKSKHARHGGACCANALEIRRWTHFNAMRQKKGRVSSVKIKIGVGVIPRHSWELNIWVSKVEQKRRLETDAIIWVRWYFQRCSPTKKVSFEGISLHANNILQEQLKTSQYSKSMFSKWPFPVVWGPTLLENMVIIIDPRGISCSLLQWDDEMLTLRETVGLHDIQESLHHVEQDPYRARFVMSHCLINSRRNITEIQLSRRWESPRLRL